MRWKKVEIIAALEKLRVPFDKRLRRRPLLHLYISKRLETDLSESVRSDLETKKLELEIQLLKQKAEEASLPHYKLKKGEIFDLLLDSGLPEADLKGKGKKELLLLLQSQAIPSK